MLTSKPSKAGKVVICGMKGIGKTAILEQLIYGNVTPETVSENHYMISSQFLFKINDFILRNLRQQLKIHMLQVLILVVVHVIFYEFLIRPVCREMFR